MNKLVNHIFILLCISLSLASCSGKRPVEEAEIIFNRGAYPSAAYHDGMYYYVMQAYSSDSIVIYSSLTLEDISKGEKRVVATSETNGMQNFYSPEIHRINGKWYIYFEGDDGNTDNHQIYVLENTGDDPMQGYWIQHGPIITTDEWNFGIHPNTFVVDGRQYLVWSGWQRQRVETETQCIFIAEMENPWTLKSDRVTISMPQYEWERQWINPSGHRSAYPIFVNENPEAMISPDGRNVIIGYSASGIWTIYNSLGMLYASTRSNLLDPNSWAKVSEPCFVAPEDSGIFGTSNIFVVEAADGGDPYMLYQTKSYNDNGDITSHVRLKRITFDENSLPLFGNP